ncbi:hypothetical protein A3A20_01985 [Candidatus Wolfebacteria bacterium RIFCSPLOWO2_01_FULL_45_19]|uniref:Uncharacterized protein n=1 Tax=Candidatus Wolfebacteria bacterium RIFCSPLOWO2_01_FULL_45_19 TaxID=1802557 RepID=A0A1F8DSW4_9BACT|nr:MAG: hypothetical protein UX23_C0001G0036 [Parcubacteria group bacterium GW2011_GWB1_45_9]OGM91684.1 MAG: hypothetical protein A3A20_01985 [Candidatus Wolfebacteria bacterium RIFCSPLOWO2_01_FULL_45_19]
MKFHMKKSYWINLGLGLGVGLMWGFGIFTYGFLARANVLIAEFLISVFPFLNFKLFEPEYIYIYIF